MTIYQLSEAYDRYRSFAMPETMSHLFDEHRDSLNINKDYKPSRIYKCSNVTIPGGIKDGRR
jgi:hypothetical protein